uniref:Uncharacterized protein n=1 Tax=Anguilla anguilla TaxID=7936 RepID=A0A0E9U135_ANGAN
MPFLVQVSSLQYNTTLGGLQICNHVL